MRQDCGIAFDAPEPVTLSDEEMARIAGVYTNPNADLTIVVEDGGFRLDLVGKDPESDEVQELPPEYAKPISADEIVLTTGAAHGMRADVIANDDGSPRFLRFGGRVMDRKTD